MNKEYRAGKISNLYFYRKDDPIKNSDSYCIENKYNLSDFLEKCSIYNEEIACVTKIGMYVESYNSNGYADFKELNFAK